MRSPILQRLEQYEQLREDVRTGMTTQRKVIWTVGNVLILAGLLMLLFVGGLLADEQYNVYAASGDNAEVAPAPATAFEAAPESLPSVALPAAESVAAQAKPAEAAAPRAPSRFNIPVLNGSSGTELSNAVPAVVGNAGTSTLTRIVVPAINLDKKVLEVGWTVQEIDGQEVAIWEVDKYRVGHHRGTSNPGEGGNVVLAGHSGGRAYPFNDIYYLEPGDLIELHSGGQVFEYHVSDHILVDEVGQPLEKRLENARYIEPTDEEFVTMVACWPLTGPDKFKQRIIIRARPVGAALPDDDSTREHSAWTAR